MRPETPGGWQAVDAAYAAVKPFPARDQGTATAWAVVAVLSAMRERERLKDAPEGKPAFDRACDDTLAYLRREIEALRFTKAHGFVAQAGRNEGIGRSPGGAGDALS